MYRMINSRFQEFDYDRWVSYFQSNDRQRLSVDCSGEPPLTPEQRQLIFPSLTSFQRGEQSEGTSLLRAAKQFAAEYGEESYPEAIYWFIKEENMHSGYLAQYMEQHNVKKRSANILDALFRKIRRQDGIRSEVTVLVTAEIIALSYYTALGNASDSQVLKQICRQMLHDELPHVVFQSYTLSHFEQGIGAVVKRFLFMKMSCLAVWLAYGNLFRAGGYSYLKLVTESMGYLWQSVRISRMRETFVDE